MSSRIEVELTSARPDGSWTWRKAGAQKPKGVVDGSLLPSGAKVGDTLKAEADIDLDGITITSFLAGKEKPKEDNRLELLADEKPFEPITSVLAGRGERRDRRDRDDRPRDRDRGDRGPRGDRPGGRPGDRADRGGPRADRPADRGPRGDRPPRADRPVGERGDRPPRADRPAGDRGPRPPRPTRPLPEPKPKPKRLKAGRAHRSTLLAELAPEERPIAEQLLRGGLPAVRQALDEQNAALRAEGKPEVKPAGVLQLAEQLLPRTRAADWRDRAEGALADVDELDLRDLRSVVVAASDGARDDETRALAAQLRDALTRRQDSAHTEWLAEITEALESGRVVRALRLSSRPPKAGVPFPAELATRLTEATATNLTADASGERWVAVLDAAAYAPVHTAIAPASVPSPVPDDITAAVTRLAALVPGVAKAFGIEVPANARPPRAPRPGGPRKPGGPGGQGGAKPTPPKPPKPAVATTADAPAPVTEAPADEATAADAPVADAPVADAPVAEATADEAPAADAPADDAPVAEASADEAPAPEASTDDAPAAETPTDDAAAPAEAPTADDAPMADEAGTDEAATPDVSDES